MILKHVIRSLIHLIKTSEASTCAKIKYKKYQTNQIKFNK